MSNTKNIGNIGNPAKRAAFKSAKAERNSEAYGIESAVGKPKERQFNGVRETVKPRKFSK